MGLEVSFEGVHSTADTNVLNLITTNRDSGQIQYSGLAKSDVHEPAAMR